MPGNPTPGHPGTNSPPDSSVAGCPQAPAHPVQGKEQSQKVLEELWGGRTTVALGKQNPVLAT